MALNYYPPSREGKKQIAGFFEPEVSKLLRQIALDEETSVQELLAEGINAVLKKRGKKPLAWVVIAGLAFVWVLYIL